MFRVPELDEPIITDTADTDWYTKTQSFALMVEQPNIYGTLVLIDRDNRKLPKGFHEHFVRQIELWAQATLSPESEEHMRRTTGHYMPEWFFTYERAWRPNPDIIFAHDNGDGTETVFVHGPAHEIVRYEPSLLAIMSEVVNRLEGAVPDPDFEAKIYEKAKRLAALGADFSEMNTRRRPFRGIQNLSIGAIKAGAGGHLKGTSNVMLAAKYNLAPIGTMGHFYPMVQAGQYGVRSANLMAMTHWDNVYHGILGTMITDTFTTPKFLEDFTPHFANLFRGSREDSGSSKQHIDWFHDFYRRMGIDPLTKEATFTNALDDIKIASIKAYVEGKLRDYYGIGGWWTRDIGCIILNIVMKLWDITRPEEPNRKITVAKLSNEAGKRSGDPLAIAHYLYELDLSN